jgi:hypothetical protein
MGREQIIRFREKATVFFRHARQCATGEPVKVRILVGLFLIAAVFMATHTAITAKNASLHLKLQHDFRNAQVSVWVDNDLAYSGKITGSIKKRFGLIPTDSAQGNLSQIIPVRSGQRNIRLRIEPDDSAIQEDSISGDFSNDTERDLAASARHSGLSMSWQGTGTALVETSANFGWLSRYAGSLFLTITGSIISALVGYAIKELPARLRPSSDSATKTESLPSVELSTD